MKTIGYKELETRMIARDSADRLGTDAGLTFEVSPDVLEESRGFVIRGYLINPLGQDKEIVVFPVGRMGFFVRFAPTDALTYVGPSFPPPAPPPPMIIRVPAETRVEFTEYIYKEAEKTLNAPGMPLPPPDPVPSPDRLSLDDYQYSGAPTVELNWTFCYGQGDRPAGTLSLVLPGR